MKPYPSDTTGFGLQDSIGLTVDFLVDIPSEPGALVSSQGLVVRINRRMEDLLGEVTNNPCHKVLAGLDDICPFCPFEDLLSGIAGPVVDQIHVRHGKTWIVNVRLIPPSKGNQGLLLETVRESAEEERSILIPMVQSLTRMAQEIISQSDTDTKIEHVARHLKAGLGWPGTTKVWIEAGGQAYGEVCPSGPGGSSWQADLECEGRSLGSVHVHRTGHQSLTQIELLFLDEARALVSRLFEITEEIQALHASQENYRKLAANLAKEMWSRTEALSYETSYLQGILRCSEDMIITTDLDSCIVEFNPGSEKITGYTAEEMHGRHAGDIWEDPQERDRLMEQVKATGSISNYETRLRTKSGESREISLTLSLLTGDDGRVIGTVGVSKDITKEKAIKRELELLNSNYRETINFISHESKNSLIVISGFVHRLLDSETDPKRNHSLEIVYHHAKFLEAMSRDFLVMADLERGEFQLSRDLIESFQEEVILPAMMGLKERYPDSFSTYDTSMGGVGPVRLRGNAALLEIVFRNLFGNALKYRSTDGKIAYGVEDLGDRYKFNVWNSGPGVPAAQVERIFEKFYRIHDETTRGKKGTGLGLYNITRIIEAHGGKIWCETKPGEWINFLFTLPKE
ncbi:MAG: PAS domain-containing sensor histidine kinase [Thermodesulfobacteriota bacterium]